MMRAYVGAQTEESNTNALCVVAVVFGAAVGAAAAVVVAAVVASVVTF